MSEFRDWLDSVALLPGGGLGAIVPAKHSASRRVYRLNDTVTPERATLRPSRLSAQTVVTASMLLLILMLPSRRLHHD